MNNGLTSALADDLVAFVDYKRTMGFKYDQAAIYHIRSFDRYCTKVGHTALTRETVDGWLILETEKAAPTNTLSQISIIREFGRYLYANGDRDAFILPKQYKQRPRSAMPYLLSKDEIEAFFEACNSYNSPQRGAIRRVIYLGLFQTMYACGIRNCEARKLACKDVNLDKGTIDIIDSKGPKSRRLYLSQEMTEFLTGYDEAISVFFPNRQAFFPCSKGGFLAAHTLDRGFNYIWDAAGLARPESGRRPSAYAFRHHFAFANIARWATEESGVETMAPYLTQYMGHTSFHSTYYYIHLSPDIVADIPVSTSMLESLLPEVDYDD